MKQLKPKTIKQKFLQITTIEMELAIAKYFGIRKHIIVPNISWGFGMHECDLFLIKKTGVAVEVEIKISKSDFLADFKKRHNHDDSKNRITEFYYAFPLELYDKCKDLVPENAGILVCEKHYSSYRNEDVITVIIKRKPKRINGARKLTIAEQLKIARLGCMRIWTLKQKIIKNGNKKIQ